MSNRYRRIVFASRPTGWVVPENFHLETLPIPSLGPNLVRPSDHRHRRAADKVKHECLRPVAEPVARRASNRSQPTP